MQFSEALASECVGRGLQLQQEDVILLIVGLLEQLDPLLEVVVGGQDEVCLAVFSVEVPHVRLD